jgi:outer membrane protein assembly factor BamB
MLLCPRPRARFGWLVVAVALLSTGVTGCHPQSRFGPLAEDWSVPLGSQSVPIAAKPAVGYGRVYIGSWNGWEYAFDEASGALSWMTYLGKSDSCAGGPARGVTSSPWLQNGVAYLGGGDSYWYALDANGGGILWRVLVGDASATGGNYNWSSPVALNGHAYVGVASHCDNPFVQGKLLRVSMSTHQIVNEWKVVPDGQKGGTIWTSPVADAARNTVYVTTGNRAYTFSNNDTQPYAEAMVAVDATTLAVKSYWSLPVSDPTPDADWGTSPTLFTDAQGRDLVSAGNKNGKVYAFLRDNVTAGPVWSRQLADPAAGDDPGAGGLYSNGFFDGQRLYYAGGRTTIAGRTVKGSIRALNPATGATVWERELPAKTYGALTGANGMVVVPAYDALRLLDGATGEVLYGNDLGYAIFGAATVANGRLFIGDTGSFAHAFRYPTAPTAAAATRASALQIKP